MQLRMLGRRSLNGSMTVVGDIAQATGAWAHADWDEILAQLPDRRPARRAELTIGYRIPAPNMELAARVLRVAAPDLAPPRSIREDGSTPRFVNVAATTTTSAVWWPRLRSPSSKRSTPATSASSSRRRWSTS